MEYCLGPVRTILIIGRLVSDHIYGDIFLTSIIGIFMTGWLIVGCFLLLIFSRLGRAPLCDFNSFVAGVPDPKSSFGVEGSSLPPTQVLVKLLMLVRLQALWLLCLDSYKFLFVIQLVFVSLCAHFYFVFWCGREGF